MVHEDTSTSNSRLTGLGNDLAWFSSLSSKHCICGLHGAVYVLKFCWLHPFPYLLVS